VPTTTTNNNNDVLQAATTNKTATATATAATTTEIATTTTMTPSKNTRGPKVMQQESAESFSGEKIKIRADKQSEPVLITDALSDVRIK
jgi:hypothetical protein